MSGEVLSGLLIVGFNGYRTCGPQLQGVAILLRFPVSFASIMPPAATGTIGTCAVQDACFSQGRDDGSRRIAQLGCQQGRGHAQRARPPPWASSAGRRVLGGRTACQSPGPVLQWTMPLYDAVYLPPGPAMQARCDSPCKRQKPRLPPPLPDIGEASRGRGLALVSSSASTQLQFASSAGSGATRTPSPGDCQ